MNHHTAPHATDEPVVADYLPQLDGLRAIAVLAVMFHHFILAGPWGHWGVHLFFVLSGFLITRLLIDARDKCVGFGRPRWFAFRQFYARRFLRIFPVYYLVLAVAIAVDLPNARSNAWWLLGYAANVKMALEGQWTPNFDHFWSLCVEEQFYLLWPWIVLCTPAIALRSVVVAMICVGPLYRGLATLFGVNEIAVHTLTPACFDSLGLGALLAVNAARSPGGVAAAPKLYLIGGIALRIGGMLLWDTEFGGPLGRSLAPLGEAMIFAWIVASAANGFRGRAGAILLSGPLRYVGKISYGIYVYHRFVPGLLASAMLLLPVAVPHVLIMSISWPATLLIAAVSWRYFERPINGLKRRFPY